LQVDVLVAHVVLDQEEILDILNNLDLLKLLFLAGCIVLNQSFPLSFGFRLLIDETDLVDLANVIVPNPLNSLVLLQVVAEV